MQGSDNADACQHEDMLRLLEDSLLLCRDMLGPEHPSTLATMNNLAACYQAAGRLDKALPLLEETMRLREAAANA